jgi:speckle-type POZ protein
MYGKMKDTKAQCVTVEDMQPDVFKSLLNFIYTDALPVFDDDIDDNDYSEIIKHLLVAADKYAMDRLKLLCASILVEHLCVETVATTLALADQHNCKSLRDICIEFMASSDMMRDVVATQGYANLKITCPSVIVDVLEKTSRCRKI